MPVPVPVPVTVPVTVTVTVPVPVTVTVMVIAPVPVIVIVTDSAGTLRCMSSVISSMMTSAMLGVNPDPFRAPHELSKISFSSWVRRVASRSSSSSPPS